MSLDIGTSKVLAIVAEILPDGQLEITGIGMQPTRGMKKGVVVNIDATVQSVQRAIEEAELMSGAQIRSVYTGISGSHIHSFNSHGFVAVKNNEVGADDVARVIECAQAITIPNEQKILHVLPQEYTVDHQSGIIDPVGMSGIRLEGKVHIVTGAITAAQNLINCIRRCGLEVQDIVLEQLAIAHAVLTEDEKQLGVCLIDIGGGTTKVAVYSDGAIRHTAVLSVAGDQVTNDIAVAFRTSQQNAETIKIKHGCANKKMADKRKCIKLNNVSQSQEQEIDQYSLTEIIEPRYEELFALILDNLHKSGWDGLLSAGVVLTGGSAKMPGVVQLAEEIFQTHIRLGLPRFTANMPSIISNPVYATGVGLILYGQQSQGPFKAEVKPHVDLKSMFGRVKNWFQGNF